MKKRGMPEGKNQVILSQAKVHWRVLLGLGLAANVRKQIKMLLRSGKSSPNSSRSIKNEVQQSPVEIVDSEISFHFNVRQQNSIEVKQEVNTLDWLKTMVIIYQDLFYFDIKKEPKEDYEAEVYEPKIRKKRRKRRRQFF